MRNQSRACRSSAESLENSIRSKGDLQSARGAFFLTREGMIACLCNVGHHKKSSTPKTNRELDASR